MNGEKLVAIISDAASTGIKIKLDYLIPAPILVCTVSTVHIAWRCESTAKVVFFSGLFQRHHI